MLLNRRKIRTPRLREQRRTAIVNLVAVFIALIGAFVLLFSQLSMLPAISVQEIEVVGNDVLRDKIFLDEARNEMRGHYLGLFSKRNIFLYPRVHIENVILGKYPRVKTIDVDFDRFNRIVLNVSERASYVLYCESSSSGKCFTADDSGFIFAESPKFSSHSYFTYNTNLVGDVLRSYVLDKEDFEEFENFIETFSEFSPKKLTSLSVEDRNEYILTLDGGADVIFDPTDGYDTVLQDLNSVFQSDAFKEDVGENLESLSYIDIRFGNKVFYKLK